MSTKPRGQKPVSMGEEADKGLGRELGKILAIGLTAGSLLIAFADKIGKKFGENSGETKREKTSAK